MGSEMCIRDRLIAIYTYRGYCSFLLVLREVQLDLVPYVYPHVVHPPRVWPVVTCLRLVLLYCVFVGVLLFEVEFLLVSKL